MTSAVVERRTPRLLLRAFVDDDRPTFAAINADPAVMAHYPAPLTRQQSDALADRVLATNVGGTEKVIGGAVKQGLKTIVHVSSVTALYNPKAAYRTPRLDRMAAEGVRFVDAHSPSTICSPSRYGLFSGNQIYRSTGRGGRPSTASFRCGCRR